MGVLANVPACGVEGIHDVVCWYVGEANDIPVWTWNCHLWVDDVVCQQSGHGLKNEGNTAFSRCLAVSGDRRDPRIPLPWICGNLMSFRGRTPAISRSLWVRQWYFPSLVLSPT